MGRPDSESHRRKRWEYLWVPIAEGGIVLCTGIIGVLAGRAILFSSLGATGFEQIEKPNAPSAHLYNVVVGHMGGLVSGFAGLAILHAWHEPRVLSTQQLTLTRVWAGVLAVVLTVLLNNLLKATQPAACSTALLVSLGTFQTAREAALVIAGVIVVAAVGEPLRRLRIARLAVRKQPLDVS